MSQTCKKMKKLKKHNGFTFIEIIVAMTLIAVVFIPLMEMFTVAIENITLAKVMTTAINIGRQHMEMVKNLNLPEDRLRKLPKEQFFPPLNKPPMEINDTYWRVKRIIHQKSDPVKVDIYVYEEGEAEPLFTLTTLFEDNF